MDWKRTAAAVIAIAIIGVLTVGVITGDLGFLLGLETKVASADPAGADATAAAVGYEKTDTERIVQNESASVLGQTRTVRVTNHMTEYSKVMSIPGMGEQRAATFVVLTTPEVSILGFSLNPVGDMGPPGIAERIEAQRGDISVGKKVGTTTVESLGTQTDVAKFEGSTTLDGGLTVSVYVHVTKVYHQGDYVLAVGAYPQLLDGERSNVLDMIRNLDHPAGS